MGQDTDEDRIEETDRMKNDQIAAQLRARSAQVFANSKFQEWFRNGGKGDLATLDEVMELSFARQTFEESETPRVRCNLKVDNKALFLFDPQHPLRRPVYNLVKDPRWDLFILIVILVSTILLAMDNAKARESDSMVSFFSAADDVFLVIFTIEFAFKVLAFGWIWCDNIEFMLTDQDNLKALVLGDTGEPAFLYSPWNYLDMVVLAVSYIGKFSNPDGPLKILRLLRAFRPLRMVNRVAGMKLVLGALVSACPALGNVCVLLVAVFLIFAILGVSLFMGKFFYCNDGDAANKDECYGSFVGDDSFLVPKKWMNPALDGFGTQNFDNVGNSFLLLFEVATGDSWETVLFFCTDISDKLGDQPKEDQNRWYGMFVIVFVFVGQLFMLQLFVSVIIDSFNFTEGSGLLTGDQALFSDMLQLNQMLQPEPKPEPAENEGYRLQAYNMFMNCDPVPIDDIDVFLHLPSPPEPDEPNYASQLAAHEDLLKKPIYDPKYRDSTGQRIPYFDAMDRQESEKAKLAAFNADMEDPKYQANPKVLSIMEREADKMSEFIMQAQIDIDFCDKFTMAALSSQPPPDDSWVYKMGKSFDIIITICIICNIAFMCTTHYEQPDSWTAVQRAQNIFFLVVFIFEFIIKHIGLGLSAYWSDPFNAFDGLVVLVSIVFVFIPGGAIAGLFRIGRVFRLIKRAPQLRALMSTMVMTVPDISNVFAVMLLLFFIFAVIGVELFGKVRYGFSINQVNNYQTWAMAMLTLWRATLGNWRSNMYDCMVQPPYCTEDFRTVDGWEVDDCGNPMASVLYHTIFQIFSTFAVLNVVIAIILGAFTWCYSLEQSELTSNLSINADHLRHFKAIWDRFDPYGTGDMPIERFQLFLAVVRLNIPQFFSTGVRTQNDEVLFKDMSSFGRPSEEESLRERKNRDAYNEFVRTLGTFERSAELWKQLNLAGCDVWNGCNDNVAGFDIKQHPLGSTDANLHIFTKEVNNGIIHVPAYTPGGPPVRTTVQAVRFGSVINTLTLGPIGLDDHDVYVCYKFKDPLSYFQPGYFADKYPSSDGQVTDVHMHTY
jgi:hypothetical protein